jgi:lipid-A-disaccharide synthase
MKKVLISAGEPSGDLHGGSLIGELKKLLKVDFYGMGGEKMREAGCHILYDCSGLSVVGFSEIFSKLSKLREASKVLNRFMLEKKPSLVVLIDYPGFNLRLARMAKTKSIPVVYYVSPQVWAWGNWRIRSIEKYVDELICILPFETDFYRRYSVKATFVGHPLLDSVNPKLREADFHRKLGLQGGKILIGLLPGSRKEEVRRILPIMLEVKKGLEQFLDAQFILIVFPGVSSQVRRMLGNADADMAIVESNTHDAIKYSDILLCTSGTVTLEALILDTPMLILYKVSFLSWLLGRLLVKIPHIGLVNIIAGKEIAREFVQFAAKPKEIVDASIGLLNTRDRMKNELKSVRKRLGERGAAKRAAVLVSQILTRCS